MCLRSGDVMEQCCFQGSLLSPSDPKVTADGRWMIHIDVVWSHIWWHKWRKEVYWRPIIDRRFGGSTNLIQLSLVQHNSGKKFFTIFFAHPWLILKKRASCFYFCAKRSVIYLHSMLDLATRLVGSSNEIRKNLEFSPRSSVHTYGNISKSVHYFFWNFAVS